MDAKSYEISTLRARPPRRTREPLGGANLKPPAIVTSRPRRRVMHGAVITSLRRKVSSQSGVMIKGP